MWVYTKLRIGINVRHNRDFWNRSTPKNCTFLPARQPIMSQHSITWRARVENREMGMMGGDPSIHERGRWLNSRFISVRRKEVDWCSDRAGRNRVLWTPSTTVCMFLVENGSRFTRLTAKSNREVFLESQERKNLVSRLENIQENRLSDNGVLELMDNYLSGICTRWVLAAWLHPGRLRSYPYWPNHLRRPWLHLAYTNVLLHLPVRRVYTSIHILLQVSNPFMLTQLSIYTYIFASSHLLINIYLL